MAYTINLNDLKQESLEALTEMARDRKMDPGNMIKILGLEDKESEVETQSRDYEIRIRDE